MNLTPEWQTERSRINHDWLKNKFINNLYSLARYPEDTYTWKNTKANFEQWDEQIGKLQTLVDTIEYAMSPARLFEQPPLDKISDCHKSWMVPLLHKYWYKKNNIRDIKVKLSVGLENVKRAFTRFKLQFESGYFTSLDVIFFIKICQDYSEYLSSLRELSALP